MEIRFCDQCDSSIPEADLDRGVSARLDGRLLCSLCLPRSRRRRLFALSLYPLSLLAAVAMGAGLSTVLLTPRIESLETQISSVAHREENRPAVDPAVIGALERLGQVDHSLTGAIEELRTTMEERDGEVSAALEDLATKLTVLATEAREVREFLARTASAPPPPDPEPPERGPKTGPKTGPEPRAAPTVDVDVWLPLTADADPGVRLSALVALEPVREERVLAAARAALGDSDPVVRAQGAKMVGDRKDATSVADLVMMLEDRNPRVRVVSHQALEDITGLRLDFDATDSEESRKGAAQAIRKVLLK